MNHPCGPAQMTSTLYYVALEWVPGIPQSGGFQSGGYPSGEDCYKYRWPTLRFSIRTSRWGKVDRNLNFDVKGDTQQVGNDWITVGQADPRAGNKPDLWCRAKLGLA